MDRKLFAKKRFFILAFALTFIFYMPLLIAFGSIGIGDWDSHIAWNEFTRLSIAVYHQFPFWNPYHCGGIPHFANPQLSVISIQTLLLLIFGSSHGTVISIFIHGLIGFIGFYLLSKEYSLSSRASFLSSIVFSFSGVLSSSLLTGMIPFIGIAYVPYILFFYHKGEKENKYRLIASGLLALSYYFGYQITLLLLAYIAIYSCTTSILRYDIKHLKAFLSFFLIFIVLIAPKLLLSLQLLSIFPRNIIDRSGYSIYHLAYLLLSKQQGLIPTETNRMFSYEIDENSLYVGFLPVTLFALFFINNVSEIKRNKILLITLMCITLLMLGNSLSPSPYELLKSIPVFSSFRVAQRFRFDWIILFSLIVGFGFDNISRLVNKSVYRNILFIASAIYIYVDLTIFSSASFLTKGLIINDFFPKAPRNEFTQETGTENYPLVSYVQDRIPKNMEYTGIYTPWSLEYIALRNNTGTVYCYDPLRVRSTVSTSKSSDYKGEWYLKKTSQKIIPSYWSPQKVSFSLNANDSKMDEDVLIINQNYYPGWFVNVDGKIREVENSQGLLSTKIENQNKEVTFEYLPFKWYLSHMMDFTHTSSNH